MSKWPVHKTIFIGQWWGNGFALRNGQWPVFIYFWPHILDFDLIFTLIYFHISLAVYVSVPLWDLLPAPHTYTPNRSNSNNNDQKQIILCPVACNLFDTRTHTHTQCVITLLFKREDTHRKREREREMPILIIHSYSNQTIIAVNFKMAAAVAWCNQDNRFGIQGKNSRSTCNSFIFHCLTYNKPYATITMQ